MLGPGNFQIRVSILNVDNIKVYKDFGQRNAMASANLCIIIYRSQIRGISSTIEFVRFLLIEINAIQCCIHKYSSHFKSFHIVIIIIFYLVCAHMMQGYYYECFSNGQCTKRGLVRPDEIQDVAWWGGCWLAQLTATMTIRSISLDGKETKKTEALTTAISCISAFTNWCPLEQQE